MANPQILAYIKENYPKFPKETVIQSLQSAGWSAVDISAALMEIEHPAPVTPPAPAPVMPPPIMAEPAQQRPIGSVEPRPVAAPASAAVVMTPATSATTASAVTPDSNAAFLAEMEKRRKEAEAMHPQTIAQGNVTISPGNYSSTQTTVTQGGLVGMVMKTGLVKTEQQANMVLIGVIVVCLGAAAWFTLG